jgi:hypothetical protein
MVGERAIASASFSALHACRLSTVRCREPFFDGTAPLFPDNAVAAANSFSGFRKRGDIVDAADLFGAGGIGRATNQGGDHAKTNGDLG